MTVTLNSVTTGDSTPAVAPYRVSNVASYNAAVVDFTVSGTGSVQAYRLRSGGSTRANGVDVGHQGAVCGLDVAGPSTRALSVATPASFTPSITAASLTTGDGTYTINLYALRNGAWE